MRPGYILRRCTCCGDTFETRERAKGYDTGRCFACRMHCPPPRSTYPPECKVKATRSAQK
jgi:hypothetical protein